MTPSLGRSLTRKRSEKQRTLSSLESKSRASEFSLKRMAGSGWRQDRVVDGVGVPVPDCPQMAATTTSRKTPFIELTLQAQGDNLRRFEHLSRQPVQQWCA